MLIWAEKVGGLSVGSGTLVGPLLVLTAAHVVFDDDGCPASLVTVAGVQAPDVAARVIWPSRYIARGARQFDVALIEITDPSWAAPRFRPLRWGRLTGRQAGVVCEAMGFPQALEDPAGFRYAEQISAEINPGSRREAGRYDLTVKSAVPTQLRDRPSPWGGMSGAGVFANGRLVAVISGDERRSFSGDRLSAVPIYRVADDPQFTGLISAAGGGLGGPEHLESVELGDVLTPIYRPVSRRDGRQRSSPAMLLHPEAGVVKFHGRRQVMDTLFAWCDDRDVGVGVRLLTGPGGQGKTRSARQLAEQLLKLRPFGDDVGWVCGFLNASADAHDLARIADTDAPLLVIVDYSETRFEQLRRLLPLLWDADSAVPVRVLLLARSAAEWWTRLTRELGEELGQVVPLGELDAAEDRVAQFTEAVAAFAARLENDPLSATGDAHAIRPPPDIDHARYGTPLTLQLAALTRLLEITQRLDAPPGDGNAESVLLRHEETYWRSGAKAEGLQLSAPTLRRVVAAATLCGAGSFDDARALAAALPGVDDLTSDHLQRLDSWLTGLYPPSPGQRWGSLEPDRLGEYLIATTLPVVDGLLGALLTATSPARHHRALTILAAAMSNSAVSAGERSELCTQVQAALTDNLADLGPVALKVITETLYPEPMLAVLGGAADAADDGVLSQLVDVLPEFSRSLEELSALWTGRRVAHLRTGVTAGNGATPALAAALDMYSRRLSALVRLEEALAASTEAVERYRQLIDSGAQALNQDLANALTNRSDCLADLGRPGDAFEASTEAVDLHGDQAAARPADLARSLTSHAHRLTLLGRYEEALVVSGDAVAKYPQPATAPGDARNRAWALRIQSYVSRCLGQLEQAQDASTANIAIYHELAAAEPDTFIRGLASAHIDHSAVLWQLGRFEDALAEITEAVEINRQLADARPDADEPELARALNHQSALLALLGRFEEARDANLRALATFEKLAAARPKDFTRDLCRARRTRARLLAEVGRLEEALAVSSDTLSLLRDLGAARTDDETALLGGELNLRAQLLMSLGRYEDALTASSNAVAIFQDQAAAYPEAASESFAQALQERAEQLAYLSRHTQAVAASNEAIKIYRQMVCARPEASTRGLARALVRHAGRLAEMRCYPEALDASTESVRRLRKLAKGQSEVLTDLALALTQHAERLAELGHHDKAAKTSTKAVDLYQKLAADHPEAFTEVLAWTLVRHAERLAELGNHDKAVTASTDAVDIYRDLANTRPEASTQSWLAVALMQHAERLADMHCYAKALDASTESVDIYQKLVADRRGAFTEGLTWTLVRHAERLAELGHHDKAAKTSTKAINNYKKLAADRPEAFRPLLAWALVRHAERLAELGHHDKAAKTSTEAINIYKKLAVDRPEASTQGLAGALVRHAERLASIGRHDQAAAASTEAVTTYLELAVACPEGIAPDLAKALRNQSERLAELGQFLDALRAITKALEMFQRLAAARAMFVPDVARSLVLQGLRYADHGDLEAAVSADRDAVSAYSGLVCAAAERHRDGYEQAIESLTQHLAALGRTEREIESPR
jgi:tetratricopeptide (TPR) repeat protein